MSDHIRLLELCKFQSHDHSVFELHPGVNIFVGPNDTGKSAILRGFCSLAMMTPLLIRSGSREGRVGMIFEQGGVGRTRKEDKHGKLVNQKYILDLPEKNPEAWTRLGRSLPVPLEKFINMGPVALDDRTKFSLNVSTQHDPPFLIGPGFTSATRIKILGSITDQHLFDEGARQFANEKRTSDGEIKVFNELLLEARDNLKALEEEEDLSAVSEKIVELQGRLETIRLEREKLEALSNRLRNLRTQKQEIDERLHSLPSTDDLERYCEALGQATREKEQCTSLLHRLTGRKEDLAGVVRHLLEMPDLSRLGSLLGAWEDLDPRVEQDLLHRLDHGSRESSELQDRISALGVSEKAQELLEAAGQTTGEKERLFVLLHRTEAIRGDHNELEIDLAQARGNLTGAHEQLAKMADEVGLCPFWDEVEFQPACRKKLKV